MTVLLRNMPAPLLHVLRKILTSCIQSAYIQENGTPCPPYLYRIRDLSILPNILQVNTSWWKLTLQQVAVLFHQDAEEFYQQLSHDFQTLPTATMQEIGHCILEYRKAIRQDLPFRLKRLHAWNVSGWTPTVKGGDAKIRLVKRLLRTGPVLIQETRWHAETHQVLYHNIPGIQVAHTQGIVTEKGGISGGTAVLIPPGWSLDRTEIIIPGRIVMAVVQDRYSTIGILSVYLHPATKAVELRELVTWAKNGRIDFPLYLGGDFNQADTSCPDLWNELLIHAHVIDTCPRLKTFESPSGKSALDRILCPTDYIAAAQMDVLVSATRRHHLSGHYQLTATFVVRPKVKSDMADPIHQTIPSEVFCPGKNESDPYTIPNDLQELIRRIQRLPQTDELDFVATLWSWWRQQPIPSNHPRIPDYELLRKFLKIRAEVLHVPSTHFYALQEATHHIFATNVISEIYPGKVTIRSDLLKQIFDFLDQITATRRYPDLEQVNQQARGIGNNITFWNRLRAICPKGMLYNGPVLNRQGEQCTTSKMLDEAMLDTRHFWFAKPQDAIEEWEPILTEYQTASPWPEIVIPDKQDFLHTLLGTKDSAPGPDGIPYSAWRLSPEDSYPVLDQLMMRMISGLRAAPVQVGVWIPKAKVGPTADFFRPLGMPNTCDRLVDGTIAAVVMKATSAYMHPSQVVMNCFKEPQHAVHAIQALLDSTTPMAALLVDLSKAFERVNPYWILRILRMRRAPTWVCNYARYILFGRLIRHKVQGRLLPPRAVHVGVDMGRSFSVFLFCLAMDPIYHYLNRIPRVMSVQGYIDDNTIAGPGHDIAWVSRVHYCYQCCGTAGFQIDQHACWRAVSSDCPPFSLQQVADRRESQAIGRLPTFPTARAAILAALLPRKTLILVRADKCIGLTPREACEILQGMDYTPLSPLLALECSCRCKTALVINTPLPSWVLRQIDQAGFGAHCIQGVATSLGLLLLGRAQLADRGLWTLTSHPTTLKQINPKAAEKFIHRLRLFRQPVLSVVSKSIAFNTFAQSVVLYTTSYFGAATEDLQMLRAAATELLLGRNWIRQDFLAFVFRWCKIAPLLDPGVSIIVSALGLFLRKGGFAHELYEENPPAVNRQTHEVRVLWQAWSRIVGEEVLTRALSSRGSIKQRIHAVKKCILDCMIQLASQYVRNKILTSGWTGGIGWKWLSEARETSKRWIPGITRFALLRWAVNEDDDEWLARRGQSRQKKCALCANQGRAYPLGGFHTAICETCIATRQITAFTVNTRGGPLDHLPRTVPADDQTERQEAWESCVACNQGDNTIGHWVRWCTVPIMALRDLTGDVTIISLAEGSRRGPKQLAIASRIVHQFRLLLREAGAMRHQVTAPSVPPDTWINKLVQRVQTELPSDLRMQQVKGQHMITRCSLEESLICCCDKPPLHIASAMAPARVCMSLSAIENNQIVAVVPLGSEILQLTQQSVLLGTGISPNVALSTFLCECGDYHCRIVALKPIGTQEILSSYIQPTRTTLLVQFDGSCHTDKGTGGAGAALLELQKEGLTLLKWKAVALPRCPDNIYAEAMSADIATDLLCEELIWRNYQVEQIYMQGDILPIVKHLAFAGRFRRIDLQPIIQRIRRKQSRYFDLGKWVYRPREANILADYFAGIASKAALTMAASHSDPVEITVEAPYHLALKSGAIILEEKPPGITILLLTEITGASIHEVQQFAEQTTNAQYRKELQAYLSGTANMTKPRVVEYTASATDHLGRLYGRGPCAQRLPRKVRLLLFGTTHQEVDMIGSFYEIMRRLSSDNQLPRISELRSVLTDLLGLISNDQRVGVVKRHPLIVMNAGAREACAKIEREHHITCPPALLHLSHQIEMATRKLVSTHLPVLRPEYTMEDRGAAFRTLEWYEEHIMISYYKELTKRCHLTSVIWLHDGIWIPRNVTKQVIFEAECAMLDRLRVNMAGPSLFSIRDLHTETQALLLSNVNNSAQMTSHSFLSNVRSGENIPIEPRPIRWNTQAPTTGYDIFVERMAKRRRVG